MEYAQVFGRFIGQLRWNDLITDRQAGIAKTGYEPRQSSCPGSDIVVAQEDPGAGRGLDHVS
ncbi:MAG: hypothetical protein ACK44O_17825 [Novosphingobium sp.]